MVAIGLALALTSCRSSVPNPSDLKPGQCFESGLASWYGPGFLGRRTASGERFDGHQLTAAHRSLPFGTWIEVRNRDNGMAVRVRINDRGPFVRKRIIDLSRAAANQLAMVGPGVARVQLCTLTGAPPPGPELYTIQIGAFQEEDKARAFAAEVARHYPTVQVISDGTWHRVQINRFDSREIADGPRQELERLGYPALVVLIEPEHETGESP